VRTGTRVAILVALWLLAWGDVSVENVLSGLAVAGVLLLVFPPRRVPGSQVRLRRRGALHLGLHVAVQLVTSNVLMAGQILRRHPDARPGVLVHRLQVPSPEVVTIMTSVISLSPGTMVVVVDRARASLDRLEALVTSAITVVMPAAPDHPLEAP
jgi:multicomponent Na+:H+ antiporter subunit E